MNTSFELTLSVSGPLCYDLCRQMSAIMSKVFEQLINKFSLLEHCKHTSQLVEPSILDQDKVVVIKSPLVISLFGLIFSSLCQVLHDALKEGRIMMFKALWL